MNVITTQLVVTLPDSILEDKFVSENGGAFANEGNEAVFGNPFSISGSHCSFGAVGEISGW